MLEWLADQPASNPRDVAQLIAAAALRRHESRGAHVRLDFPAEDPALAHQDAVPGSAPDSVIARALAEDVGSGDVTTDAIVPADLRGSADVVVREAGVICGLDQAFAVLLELDPRLASSCSPQDGDRIDHPPQVVARLHASVRALLTGRAHRAQPAAADVRHRHDHTALRRPGGRNRRAAAGHAQDGPRPAGAGQARRGLRRRHQPPRRAARRRADQGQPRGRRRRRAGRGRARPPAASRDARSRSRSTRSASCSRRSTPART